MDDQVLRLYPPPSVRQTLPGLYLAHALRERARSAGRPLVYTDYVASLDGRIAIPHPSRPGLTVPKQIANERDWRLFQELAVQADVVLTSGRYLRDYADGRAQEILQVHNDPRFADLVAWRLDQGLPVQPDLAVISASLDFAIPQVLTQGQRRVLVITTATADPDRIADLESQLGQVLVAGDEQVDGAQLVGQLAAQGYRTIYNATGPKVMHMLLAAGVLDRLYLTIAHRLLGGQPFSSIVEGDVLEPAAGMTLHALHLDPAGVEGLGQLFAVYDRT